MRGGKAQLAAGDSAFVFVRPESLKFAAGASSASAGALDNRIGAHIHQQEFEGNFWQVFCDVDGVDKRVKLSMVNDGASMGRGPGEEVTLGFNADLAVALPQGELAAE
ncbi:MAG: TOBE domain-containing protein [Gammaproteobacteria bacterium]|nr:TOBE domain-containing protein [Gammaproteobacteria bacterium]